MCVCVCVCVFGLTVMLFLCPLFPPADENKPIWMHAEEREEQSKVRTGQGSQDESNVYTTVCFNVEYQLCPDGTFSVFESLFLNAFCVSGQAEGWLSVWRIWWLVQGL